MPSFICENVNDALPVLWQAAHDTGLTFERPSRNGPVREFYDPVTITYLSPQRRVLFNDVRAANPFFHLFEAMWMLGGRDDVAWLSQFLVRMKDFSDDGLVFHGAYGKRWWKNLALFKIIDELKSDHNTRRAYLPIFDNAKDVGYKGKDMPCNVGVAFYIRHGRLDMTVFNRSNDMILGALGANYVHFGFLQQFVASVVGVSVGRYTQISSCMHLYMNDPVTKKLDATPPMIGMSRAEMECEPYPERLFMLPYSQKQWHGDLEYFLSEYTKGNNCLNTTKQFWYQPFFSEVVAPMFRAWYCRNEPARARIALKEVMAADWRLAGEMWLKRRIARMEKTDA